MNESDKSWRALRCGSLGRLLIRFPPLQATLQSLPARRRPALVFETLANLGSGGVVRLFPIALVVLETILHADLKYQMAIACVFYGANLTSPVFTWLAGRVRSRRSVPKCAGVDPVCRLKAPASGAVRARRRRQGLGL